MKDHTKGIQQVVYKTEQMDLNGTTNLKQEIEITKDRDFYVNYVILDFWFQGATDEPTEAEKLAKLGTWNLNSLGAGQWKTDLDVDDLYYRYLARIEKGQPSFLIGDGGGDDDYHGMRIILDAGLGRSINSKCAWTPEQEAVLKMQLASDSGLDNSSVNYTLVGYKGTAPTHSLSVENLENTYSNAGDLAKFSVQEGEILQEYFAFLTTEMNLATVQANNVYGIRNLQVRPNDQEADKVILSYVNQMVDGINDGGEGLIQQYARRSFDPDFDAFGIPLHNKDKVAIEGGVAEATRHYISKLQPIGRR